MMKYVVDKFFVGLDRRPQRQEFDTEEEATIAYRGFMSKLRRVAVSTLENRSSIKLHKCFHDERPSKSCEILKRIEK